MTSHHHQHPSSTCSWSKWHMGTFGTPCESTVI